MNATEKPFASPPGILDEWIALRSGIVENNAGSVVVTLFHDCFLHRGGKVGLGSIVKLCSVLGIGEATTRSAVARLAQDGILQSIQMGRRSDYQHPDGGGPRYDGSMYRAYLPLHDEWEERFEMVALHANRFDSHSLASAASAFCHDGYGRLSDYVFCRPHREPNPYANPRDLLPPRLADAFIQFHSNLAPATGSTSVSNMLDNMWDFELLRARYRGFVADYSRLLEELWKNPIISHEVAFTLRVYAIHEYRRIVMDSPMLPVGLRPRDSACSKARYVMRELYDLLVQKSEEFIGAIAETSDGRPTVLDHAFFDRFGGLTKL